MISSTQEKIRKYLDSWVDKSFKQILSADKSAKDSKLYSNKDGRIKPFHEALLPMEILRISSFERSMSTKLGNSFEECAKIIAEERFEIVERGYVIEGPVFTNAVKEIANFSNHVGPYGHFKNYLDVAKKIAFMKDKTTENRSRIADLYLKNKHGHEIFFELKSPKPNKGQCIEVIDRHLSIHAIKHAIHPDVQTYFAMAYNPYGISKSDYKHSFSINYLDMENQVLLGDEFWDFLGGHGTNKKLLEIYHSVGVNKHHDLLSHFLKN